MTLREMIMDTADMLGNIRIPAVLMEEIGIPVYNARQNLLDCLGSIAKDPEDAAETEEKADE